MNIGHKSVPLKYVYYYRLNSINRAIVAAGFVLLHL